MTQIKNKKLVTLVRKHTSTDNGIHIFQHLVQTKTAVSSELEYRENTFWAALQKIGVVNFFKQISINK